MDESFIASAPRPLQVLRNDALVAAIFAMPVALADVSGLLIADVRGGGNQVVATIVLVIAVSVTVMLRRTRPIACGVLASVIAAVLFSVAANIIALSYFAVLIGTYSIAAFSERRFRHLGLLPLPAALIMLAGYFMFGWFIEPNSVWKPNIREDWVVLVMMSLIVSFAFATSWALGLARRSQLSDILRDRERAFLLERDAHRLAQLAVSDERNRIAREMHDIIAHSLASIVTLAEGGRMVAERQPEKSAELFEKIAASGREALTDVKVLLRRVDEQDDAPARDVSDIRELVEHTADAGLPITYVETGTPQRLPAGLSLAAYRVAQESITNVLKHAPGARTELRLVWEPESLILTTQNQLTQAVASPGRDSRGIAGMRERAEIFDGTLDTTSQDFEFTVTATWPIGRRLERGALK